jgi:iron complex outermembrane receptor protein
VKKVRNNALQLFKYVTGLLLLWALFANQAASQESYVYGTVSDSITKESLPGVNILVDSSGGIASDVYGNYLLILQPGYHNITYSYLGYKSKKIHILLKEQDSSELNIRLHSTSVLLDMAVVSAGKYEQRISDVTVSIEVMNPAFIQNINSPTLESALNYVPGLDILDGQASIRGGSGYSYGAGSRVMVLIDDLPILAEGTEEVKWNFLPVENIDQVEVLKGASSALYGSSALNGVINIRTAYPGIEPGTTVSLYTGIYSRPERDELSWWWDTHPLFSGINFTHSRKFKEIDLVVGANALSNEGYRTDNFDEQIRLNAKYRHRPKKIKNFAYGLNTNLQWQYTSDFFLWLDADSGAFMQNPLTVTPTTGHRFNVDPWITYYDTRLNKHVFLSRYYDVNNSFKDDPDKNNASRSYYGEYQFQKQFTNGLNWIIGLVGKYGTTVANLYGDHHGSNVAAYTQLDYKFFSRLSASLGLRWEYNSLDNSEQESGTVVRAGLNYQAAKKTFIRTSFGQGYRFPSLAEKYTATNLGSVNIFPNPDLKSETGWSSEIGLKQGFTIRKWSGFVDFAAFWTEYNDMIEFIFGLYPSDSSEIPTIDDLGFKSQNIGDARITGFELGISGTGFIGKRPVTLFAGYTYMNPVDLSSDTLENDILKYRYRHSFKSDIDVEVRKFSFGLSTIYASFMERIDEAFEEPILGTEIFPGLKEYRQENNTGQIILDFRASYAFTSATRLSIIVKNLLNEEYMGRPGDIQPPRSFTLQFLLDL